MTTACVWSWRGCVCAILDATSKQRCALEKLLTSKWKLSLSNLCWPGQNLIFADLVNDSQVID
jgi:hypothetical protein